MKTKMQLLAISATLALLLSACVVAPAGGPYDETATIAPPPPRFENVGPPPVTGYIWTEGYWNWIGGRHVWVAGHWEAPRPGMHWVPHRWERVGDRWRFRHGYWD